MANATEKKKGVRTTHPDYDNMLNRWQKCRDAAEGEDAVHAAKTRYLPMLTKEKPDAYNARLLRTPFFNCTWRTISGLKGLMFRRKPVTKIAAAIEEYIKDIDMAGTPIDLFTQTIVEELLELGRAGLLVDYPVGGTEGMTTAQAEAAGIRPLMSFYPALSILNWKTARVGNHIKLVLVVLRESAPLTGADEFEHVDETRYRVLDLVPNPDEDGAMRYRQRVFRINDNEQDELIANSTVWPEMNNKRMDTIPFFFFGVENSLPAVDVPPLMDLVDMNFHHYRVSADWEHACHLAGLPTFCVSGYSPPVKEDGTKDEIPVGGLTALCFDHPQAKAYYAEVSGSFDGPLMTNLKEKVLQMAVLGARMLEQRAPTVESGDTIRTRTEGEQAQLATMADVVSVIMTLALMLFSKWCGFDEKDTKYQVNKDFVPANMSPQMLKELLQSYLSGGISYETYFRNLQQREVIDAGKKPEEEKAQIEASPPPGGFEDVEEEGGDGAEPGTEKR